MLKASDLICVDHTGEIVVGDRPLNAAAFAIHNQVHAARPEAMAAAHNHSLHGKTLASMHELFGPSPKIRARSTTTVRCSMTSPALCSTSGGQANRRNSG